MTQPTSGEKLERLVREYEREVGPIPLLLSASQAIIVIAQLQLALRHPLNRGDGANVARRFVDGLIAYFEEHSPALAEYLRLRNQPE